MSLTDDVKSLALELGVDWSVLRPLNALRAHPNFTIRKVCCHHKPKALVSEANRQSP